METEIVGPPDAPDLVLLHGGIGTGRYHWSKLLKPLAADFRVHLPDLPGHGRTPVPDGADYGIALLADAVERYLDGLAAPAHVGGFSMGGHTSLSLASRRPDLFASLTLIGVSLRVHAGLDEWRARFDPARLEEEFPLWVGQLAKLHEPLGGPDAWREVVLRDAAGAHLAVDEAALAKLEAPVLLIRGDRDTAVDPQQYADLRRILPQAEEFVIPGGGHDVQLTRHRVVGPGLTDFLRRARRGMRD